MESSFESMLRRIGNGESTVAEELNLARLRAKENDVRIMSRAEFFKTFMPGWQIPTDAEGLTVSHFASQFKLDEWEDDPLPVLVLAADHHDFHKMECYAKLEAMIRMCVNWNKQFAS